MIKSIRTLSLPVPTRSENFNLFFQSLERAFLTKKINDEYKSEILINLLGERAHNVLLYIKEEELNDYEKLKSIVLREFQLTPRECLNSFKNAVKSSGETYIQFAARSTANFQYYCSLRKVNSFESLCDLIISDKLFETLNKETATHIGIREAEDWFRPIDLAKECDIYISSRSGSHKEIPITYGYTQDPFKNRSQNFKTKIKENYPQYLERENKNCYICGDSSHYARDCEKRFRPKESNDHIQNRINVNTLKIESEKQNSDEFANLQYRMVEVKPINLSLNQHSSGLSVRTAISPTLTEEIIIHPSVYSEIKKLGHAKRDVLLNESESSLSADCGVVSVSNVSFSNVIKNSSYDLPHVKNFNTRNDLSSLIKDYKCNKIKSTKLKLSIIREKCSDIVLCKKVNGAMKTSSVEFISRSPTPSPMEHSPLVSMERKKGIRTAADSVQSGLPLWHAAKSNLRAQTLGVCNNMLMWIRNFISQRFSAVRFGNAISSFKQSETGLPQGTVISPILFNIFINDLPDLLASDELTNTALFADDLAIWCSTPKRDQSKLNTILNLTLERLHLWCIENNMTVNLKKTTCQFFTLNRQPFSPQLLYNGMPVQQSDVSIYLGCALDNKLKWTKHAELVVSKARKRLSILKRLTGVKWGCNRDTLNTTYKTYIQPVLNYCNEVLISASENNIQYKVINDVPFELLSFANPLDYAILDIRLDLVLNVRKRDLSPTALHAIALETINTRFPPEEWLHIYTDGSLLDFALGAGIGVFSHLFSFYLHAGPLTTHFDDSTSALQALSNYNENNCLRVQNCRELLGKIKGKIVFQWVPSHCGLWGNERADFLAKKGTGILQNFRRDLTLHSAKLEIKRIFRESFRLTASRVARDKPWSTLCKKSHGIPSSPRAVAVAKFRLLTGHDCLCAHLFRFNLVTSPICVLCDTGQDMTAAHLDECSALNDLNRIVKRYWRARCLMT
ncbi:putative RNA-directed DNA polymerase from transposon X-element [Trichonephila clavipes]|uniref:Putative RNA-directed DNA polymerase from transposon X-element n=1 Tax=Trichonephila clavipes TaxID=2585209 RepID=A0A8X6SVY4_TRICX|nr:putative RNA-directed DNA polymerase from transposon X-element [Trichonephila clavipes]